MDTICDLVVTLPESVASVRQRIEMVIDPPTSGASPSGSAPEEGAAEKARLCRELPALREQAVADGTALLVWGGIDGEIKGWKPLRQPLLALQLSWANGPSCPCRPLPERTDGEHEGFHALWGPPPDSG